MYSIGVSSFFSCQLHTLCILCKNVLLKQRKREDGVEGNSITRAQLRHYHDCLRLIYTMIASRGVVRRSILSRNWISRGQNMANGWNEKKKKERAVREKRKNRRCRRQKDVRVSSGKASSGVYYYLFDDQRRMWATSPRCTSPLISDNPPRRNKKVHSHTHTHTFGVTENSTQADLAERYDRSRSKTREK